MNKKYSFLCLMLSLVMAFSLGLTACKKGSNPPSDASSSSSEGSSSSSSSINQGDDDDDDSDTGSKTVVNFYYSGDNAEQTVFTSLVNKFNTSIGAQNNIYVEPNYCDNVDTAIGNRFNTASCPDVFYVGDGPYKRYVENGYLLNITDYVENSVTANPSDMWSSIYNRYFYSTTNHRSGAEADENGGWYGLPKDIGPTVIFYNETMFKASGVNIISVAEENLDDFNYTPGYKDDRGQTRGDAGIPQGEEVPAMGFFTIESKMFFNNQIAMSWDEVRNLANLISTEQSTTGKTVYGYHTEWWFSYGWSVGGDCIEYVDAQDYNTYEGGGFYDFTLVDNTKNFMAKTDVTVNGTQYSAGEVISYQDKLQNEVQLAGIENKAGSAVYASEITNNPNNFTELPSQRDAFLEFVLLSTDTSVQIAGKNGYQVCPKPSAMGGDGAKTTTFKNKQLAMLVDGRWNVTDFRNTLDFEWDVAPLPVYKTYESDGTTVKAKGLETGHSGSVALAINGYLRNNKTKADAAWKFIEYLAGAEGQTAQSLAGFAIPSQRELAMGTDNNPNGEGGIFLNQRDAEGNLLRPYNAKAFIRAAESQHEGDWAYTKVGSAWIDGWAGLLNGQVRNGDMTFEAFMQDTAFKATYNTLKDLTKKS